MATSANKRRITIVVSADTHDRLTRFASVSPEAGLQAYLSGVLHYLTHTDRANELYSQLLRLAEKRARNDAGLVGLVADHV